MDEVITMKKFLVTTFAIILASSFLTACTNRDMGTVGGAAAGGLAGNLLTGGSGAGTVIGAIGGGVVGNQLSR
jgi:osmotically inducible lipoprotein OsmB